MLKLTNMNNVNIDDIIKNSSKILITSHINPDGDTLGTMNYYLDNKLVSSVNLLAEKDISNSPVCSLCSSGAFLCT